MINDTKQMILDHSLQHEQPAAAIYYCEACQAWWWKSYQNDNPLDRYALILSNNFNWRKYQGWRTVDEKGHICTVCGHVGVQKMTAA